MGWESLFKFHFTIYASYFPLRNYEDAQDLLLKDIQWLTNKVNGKQHYIGNFCLHILLVELCCIELFKDFKKIKTYILVPVI